MPTPNHNARFLHSTTHSSHSQASKHIIYERSDKIWWLSSFFHSAVPASYGIMPTLRRHLDIVTIHDLRKQPLVSPATQPLRSDKRTYIYPAHATWPAHGLFGWRSSNQLICQVQAHGRPKSTTRHCASCRSSSGLRCCLRSGKSSAWISAVLMSV